MRRTGEHFKRKTGNPKRIDQWSHGTANGLAEELAIRSYLLTRLSEIIGSKAAAVILTSVLFAAYHSYQGRYGVLAAVMAGLVFGTYFAKTNRFWPIFIAHFIMDALPLTLIAASSE